MLITAAAFCWTAINSEALQEKLQGSMAINIHIYSEQLQGTYINYIIYNYNYMIIMLGAVIM